MRIYLFLFLVLCSCSHSQSTEKRSIASEKNIVEEVLDEEDRAGLMAMVQEKNEQRLQQLFLGARIAQTLVSSFDERLSKVSDEASLAQLMESKLYCKLQKARFNYHGIEEKLEYSLKAANHLGVSYSRWFYDQLQKFSKKDIASQAAAGNLIRQFVTVEAEICGESGCEGSAMFNSFNPSVLDDNEFATFMAANHAEIAVFSNPIPSDLDRGDCAGPVRSPNQVGFDWKNRNWIKGNLNNGEFVVTYDDGPHSTITDQIASVWEATNYPKPAFFWLSKNAKAMPGIVQKRYRAGYPVGLHSERHADLGNLAKSSSPADLNSVNRKTFKAELANLPSGRYAAWREKTLDREIGGAAASLNEVVRTVDPDYTVRHFRLPFGSGVGHAGIGARLQASNLDHFFWRVDSLDWQDKNSVSIHKRVLTQMQASPKGIILFHDIQPQTVNATKLLLQTFRSNSGWKPVSMKQMVP